MPDHNQYIRQRLEFAMQLIRSGKPDKAIAVCEQLMSPAALYAHGSDIFEVMSFALNAIGEFETAQRFLDKSRELFSAQEPEHAQEAKIQDKTLFAMSSPMIRSSFANQLPRFTYADDAPILTAKSQDIAVNYPAFPIIKRLNNPVTIDITPVKEVKTLSALEELAKKLENAKIPALSEERSFESPAYKPSIATDTMAQIYVSQGAYTQAIKAYQILARNNPDKLDYYEQIIAELRAKY